MVYGYGALSNTYGADRNVSAFVSRNRLLMGCLLCFLKLLSVWIIHVLFFDWVRIGNMCSLIIRVKYGR